jgi:large subunit ribosomal protein L10
LALTRERKNELVAQYVDLLSKTNGFVVVQASGLSVKEIDGLRAAVRNANGKYVVAKNTLLTKALEEAGLAVPSDLLKGPNGIAFGFDNFPGVAKAVLDYAADATRTEKMKVVGGQMGSNVLSDKQVDAISKLPSLDELRGQLIGLIVAPATGIVSVIQAANSSVVNVLQAYLDDREQGAA